MSFLESGSLVLCMGQGCIALKGSTVGCAGEHLTEHSLNPLLWKLIEYVMYIRIIVIAYKSWVGAHMYLTRSLFYQYIGV